VGSQARRAPAALAACISGALLQSICEIWSSDFFLLQANCMLAIRQEFVNSLDKLGSSERPVGAGATAPGDERLGHRL
jgi:hypothetical protein